MRSQVGEHLGRGRSSHWALQPQEESDFWCSFLEVWEGVACVFLKTNPLDWDRLARKSSRGVLLGTGAVPGGLRWTRASRREDGMVCGAQNRGTVSKGSTALQPLGTLLFHLPPPRRALCVRILPHRATASLPCTWTRASRPLRGHLEFLAVKYPEFSVLQVRL